MARKVEQVPYKASKDVVLTCSVTPGNNDQVFEFKKGQVANAPAAYEKWFKRNGVVRVSESEAKAEPEKTEGKGDKGKGDK